MFRTNLGEKSEQGAAAVETALCLCFIVVPLMFATIAYAYMLSFRQTVSQGAAEGVRAAAVVPPGATSAEREAAAKKAVTAAMATGPGGLECDEGHLTCDVTTVANCGNGSTHDCMKVTVEYPYRDHSLLPSVPGLGFTLPATITYTAVAEISG